MKRYTYFDGGKWRLKIGDTEYSGDWVDRLAAYEETGLDPEELEEKQNEAYDLGYQSCLNYKGLRWDEAEELQRYREIGSINRLRELAQAEKEGRLVVLPCDVGDTVYVIDPGDYEHEYKPYVRLKTVSEINWKATRKKDLGWGLILAGGNCGTSARYKLNNVGKTVFLTREAAEAALDAMRGENNA